MKELNTVWGVGSASGCALGKAVVFTPKRQIVPRRIITDPEAELARLSKAREEYGTELSLLYKQTLQKMDQPSADIFLMYSMLLEDDDIIDNIEQMVRTEHMNADYALQSEMKRLFELFSAMEDEYMRERSSDIENIANELIMRMQGTNTSLEINKSKGKQNLILVADVLTPADIVGLDRSCIKGVVSEHGSIHSHASILCRAMGMPMVVEAQGATCCITDGSTVAVSGDTGEVVCEPDEAIIERYMAQITEHDKQRHRYEKAADLKAVTLDGQELRVTVNIFSAENLNKADWDLIDGVGLYRSDFLYLSGKDYPSEAQLFRAYKSAAEKAKGRDVVISAFDIGGDKCADYMQLPKEENPFLGKRAIRICLERPDLFCIQLRAVLKASAYGRVKLLLPMVSGTNEVKQTRHLLYRVMKQLKKENVHFDEHLPVGVMIETPAAVITSDVLAKTADFFSIGSNDLTQFILAADRLNPQVEKLYDVCSPSVLRSIALVVRNAQKHKIPVSICGEAAGDTELIPLWAALRINELSVLPCDAAQVKYHVRQMHCNGIRASLDEVLCCTSADDVRRLLKKFSQ